MHLLIYIQICGLEELTTLPKKTRKIQNPNRKRSQPKINRHDSTPTRNKTKQNKKLSQSDLNMGWSRVREKSI